MSVRSELRETLAPLVPDTWTWIQIQRVPDGIKKPTVILKQETVAPLPQAPTSCLQVTFTLTLASPHQDQEKAEDALDEDVLELLGAIDKIAHISWTSATKVTVADKYFGYDLALTVATT